VVSKGKVWLQFKIHHDFATTKALSQITGWDIRCPPAACPDCQKLFCWRQRSQWLLTGQKTAKAAEF